MCGNTLRQWHTITKIHLQVSPHLCSTYGLSAVCCNVTRCRRETTGGNLQHTLQPTPQRAICALQHTLQRATHLTLQAGNCRCGTATHCNSILVQSCSNKQLANEMRVTLQHILQWATCWWNERHWCIVRVTLLHTTALTTHVQHALTYMLSQNMYNLLKLGIDM